MQPTYTPTLASGGRKAAPDGPAASCATMLARVSIRCATAFYCDSHRCHVMRGLQIEAASIGAHLNLLEQNARLRVQGQCVAG